MNYVGVETQAAVVLADEYLKHLGSGGSSTPEAFLADHPESSPEALELLKLVANLEPERSAVPRLGQTLGPYRLVGVLGRGGMGVVYRALDTRLDRDVALKVSLRSALDTEAEERFLREARAAARLHHTHIVPVHDVGVEHGAHYYAMEHVAGTSLDHVYAEQTRLGRPLDCQRIAGLFAGVAEGLHTAHRAGIVHRDVKPSNLILASNETLMLTDFGLARIEQDARLTQTGARMGTPVYMSPEQVRGGAGAADARSDIYALGATLYEGLALRPPYEGERPEAIYHKILNTEPVPLRRINRRIPKDLATIVEKALEKRPDSRYASAAELAADLRAFVGGMPVSARPVGPVRRAWRRARRHKAVMWVLGVAVVLGIAGTAAFIVNLEEARKDAETRRTEAEDLMDFMLFDLHDKLGYVGRQDLLRDVAERARAHYESRPDDGSPESSFRLAKAIRNLGEVYQTQRRDAEALELYREGLERLTRLVRAYPERRLWRLELVDAHLQVAGMSKEPAKGLDRVRRTLGEVDGFTSRYPEDADGRAMRGHALRLQAIFYARSGRNVDGLESSRGNVRIFRSLWKEMPDKPQWGMEVALGLQVLAHLQYRLGDRAAGLEAYREEARIETRLVQEDPDNYQVKKNLAFTYANLTQKLRSEAYLKEALETTRKAEVLFGPLVERDPTDRNIRDWLEISVATRGDILRRLHRYEEALPVLRESLAMRQAHGGHHPNSHDEIGSVLTHLGEYDEAMTSFETARAVRIEMNKAKGKAPEDGMIRIWRKIGRLHEVREQWDKAIDRYRAALELGEKDLGARAGLGRALLGRGEREKALPWLRGVHSARLRDVEEKPKNVGRRRNLAQICLELGEALSTGSEDEQIESRALLEKGLEISRHLRDEGRDLALHNERVPRFQALLEQAGGK